MPKRQKRGNVAVRTGGGIAAPPDDLRLQLLHGPYSPAGGPRRGLITCVLRARPGLRMVRRKIPWPIIRVGPAAKALTR